MCTGAPLLKCESLFNPSWFSCNVDCTLGMITGVIAEHLMHQPAWRRCNLTNVLGQLLHFLFLVGWGLGSGEGDAAMRCKGCTRARRCGLK